MQAEHRVTGFSIWREISGNGARTGMNNLRRSNRLARRLSVAGQRVVRGGSWDNEREILRVSNRSGSPADDRGSSVGFRLAQDIPSF